MTRHWRENSKPALWTRWKCYGWDREHKSVLRYPRTCILHPGEARNVFLSRTSDYPTVRNEEWRSKDASVIRSLSILLMATVNHNNYMLATKSYAPVALTHVPPLFVGIPYNDQFGFQGWWWLSCLSSVRGYKLRGFSEMMMQPARPECHAYCLSRAERKVFCLY